MDKSHSENPGRKFSLDKELALKRFFESAPMMMGIADVEGDDIRHVSDNEASSEYFGIPTIQLEGKFSSELGIPKKTIKFWISKYQEAERTGKPVRFEYSHDDSRRFSVTVTFLEKTQAGYSRFSYIVQDVTELVLFTELANTLAQIIWVARPDGFVYWYNDKFYEFTGLPKNTNWDDPKLSPIHPDDLEHLVEKWSYSLKTGEPTNIEFRIRNIDGKYRWHLSRGLPIRDDEGTIVKWIGSNTDIHEQKMLVSLLEKERDLRDQFVSALSHDLRTPLTAAKMSAQLMSRRPNDQDLITKSAVRIVDNMNRADSMIRDLLDANRIKAGEKIPIEMGHCNITKIIADSIDDLRTLHGDRFIYHHSKDIEGFWSCSGVRRIIENLCNNAIKYGSSHSKITIDLLENQTDVIFKVHNEGNPISEEDQEKLFHPYRRSQSAMESSEKGWGIGLTLVKGIVEAHNGEVSVESLPEKGTTFSVRIPKK